MQKNILDIYEPEEDSYFMAETIISEIPKILKINPNIKFLEIGCGSGINLQAALGAGIKLKNIYGSDINTNAVNYCKSLGFNCILSDLFSKINGQFDLIVFNPPYLPLDEEEPKDSRINTTGGKEGNEIIIKFLKQARNHLKKTGKIILITSSLSKSVNFDRLGFKSSIISEKKLFFERLIVWELKN